jgi:rhodanese-related sulfurtransferase
LNFLENQENFESLVSGSTSLYIGGRAAVKAITVPELALKQASPDAQWVDVRSATEFAAGHVPGAVNIPMDQVESRLDDFNPSLPVVLICQSGVRAKMVSAFLRQCRQDVSVLEGGTAAWAKAGLPLVVSTKSTWSLERQVRLAAGLIALLGAVLGALVDVHWVYLSGFVGLGLTFAGLSDICPLGILLGKMPWNAVRQCKTTLPVISGA